MLSNDIHHLAEQAAQLMRDAAEAAAYATETERRATALARDLDDLTHRIRAQETEVARVVSENVELRHELDHARGQQHAAPGNRRPR